MTTSNSLVPVFTGQLNDQPTQLCNARDLHATLEIGKDFSTWIKDRIEQYGFIAGDDYSPILGNRSGGTAGKRRTDYHLTLDMAKELAMVENNDKGRQVRRYFIEIEKQARLKQVVTVNAETAPKNRPIRSRDDLSFTKRDEATRLINWHLEHDRQELWGERYTLGQGFLNLEIAELATHDERDAYHAVQFALSGEQEFRRGPSTHFGNSGWGQECGFAEAVARAVIDGLRARRAGIDGFDPDAKPLKKLPRRTAPLALPAPMKTLSAAEREAVNKQAWAETAECARECFNRKRAALLNADSQNQSRRPA